MRICQARKTAACPDVSILIANIFTVTHPGRGYGAPRWRVAYCTYKSLSLWHAVWILSARGRGLTLWFDMKRLMVCVQQRRGMRRRCLQCAYVLRCGRVSVCIHGGREGRGCLCGLIFIKAGDQKAGSAEPISCRLFYIPFHPPPHSSPASIRPPPPPSSVIWRLRPLRTPRPALIATRICFHERNQ